MKNKGVSLITLVITIIIMIIIAGAILIYLSDSDIFNKANEAVNKYNKNQQQIMDSLDWLDCEPGQRPVPSDWKENVIKIVDGVPIPKGFVASPYDGTDGLPAENKMDGGLVIYELKPGESSETDIKEADKEEFTELKDIHYNSMETRNQFVWVPVDDFKKDFKRTVYYISGSTGTQRPTYTLGSGFWELLLDDDNKPSDIQNSDYVSTITLNEAKQMYESVEKYGGFYIARYETGYADKNNKVPSITMGKYPYSDVPWGSTMEKEEVTGGAVTLARAFYPNNTANVTGVISTLTYGVQWDRTLNWWKKIKSSNLSLDNSKDYGNYKNTSILVEEFNPNAIFSEFDRDSWSLSSWRYATKDKTYDSTDSSSNKDWLLSTGAFRKANVNNIYDMAGNLMEWTMEGSSTDKRVYRGGYFQNEDYTFPVHKRSTSEPEIVHYGIGFRPSLYIKVK